MERIETAQTCARCRLCCHGYGGDIIPEDIIDTEDKFTVDLVYSKTQQPGFPMQIRCLGDGILGLSYKMQDEDGILVGGGVYFQDSNAANVRARKQLGYKCVALGASGCLLSLNDERPMNCALHACDIMSGENFYVNEQSMKAEQFFGSWEEPSVQLVMHQALRKIMEKEIMVATIIDGRAAGGTIEKKYIKWMLSEDILLDLE